MLGKRISLRPEQQKEYPKAIKPILTSAFVARLHSPIFAMIRQIYAIEPLGKAEGMVCPCSHKERMI